ncbi:MAG: hypothetical protein MUQ52_03675, partial [Pirellulales bacterium]|nr:hypothetical protein [Pirellulales bacterium]
MSIRVFSRHKISNALCDLAGTVVFLASNSVSIYSILFELLIWGHKIFIFIERYSLKTALGAR